MSLERVADQLVVGGEDAGVEVYTDALQQRRRLLYVGEQKGQCLNAQSVGNCACVTGWICADVPLSELAVEDHNGWQRCLRRLGEVPCAAPALDTQHYARFPI